MILVHVVTNGWMGSNFGIGRVGGSRSSSCSSSRAWMTPQMAGASCDGFRHGYVECECSGRV